MPAATRAIHPRAPGPIVWRVHGNGERRGVCGWHGRAGAVILALAVSGCQSQAYDPMPPSDRPLRELSFQTSLSVEESYRRLYERLEPCVSSGYHVLPRYEQSPEHAWVMVVSGLGLDRYAFLLNQFEARFDVQPAPGGSRIVVSWVDPGMESLARASRGWLLRGDAGCGA